MILKEREFCDFITGAIERSKPTKENKFEGDESLFPQVTIMQLVAGRGFWVMAEVGSVKASLGSVRNETRRFATIDSAAAFVRKLGVVAFKVVNLSVDFSK